MRLLLTLLVIFVFSSIPILAQDKVSDCTATQTQKIANLVSPVLDQLSTSNSDATENLELLKKWYMEDSEEIPNCVFGVRMKLLVGRMAAVPAKDTTFFGVILSGSDTVMEAATILKVTYDDMVEEIDIAPTKLIKSIPACTTSQMTEIAENVETHLADFYDLYTTTQDKGFADPYGDPSYVVGITAMEIKWLTEIAPELPDCALSISLQTSFERASTDYMLIGLISSMDYGGYGQDLFDEVFEEHLPDLIDDLEVALADTLLLAEELGIEFPQANK